MWKTLLCLQLDLERSSRFHYIPNSAPSIQYCMLLLLIASEHASTVAVRVATAQRLLARVQQ